MKKTLLGAASVVALSALSAAAATQTGNLNVTTTIQVSCNAPSPSGTLRLPFDSAKSLINQSEPDTPVTVTVTCYGNPTVNHVDFDDGQNRDALERDEAGVRYMLKASNTASFDPDPEPVSEANYLGYVLYADIGDDGLDVETKKSILEEGSANNGNRLGINASTATFQVSGKVFESVERSGAFGSPIATASGANVPGGTYNDIVVMTVDYN